MAEIFVEPEPGTPADSTIHVPRGPLIGASLLVALVFGVAIQARVSGHTASQEPVTAVALQREVRFDMQGDGTLSVFDVGQDREIARLSSDKNGFIFGMLRGIKQKRDVAQTDPATPFRITKWQDGRMTLDDPSTGMHIAVSSFGPTQVQSFSQLFQ
jgi:putative photosynthetic complex assembly protein